VGRLFAPDQPDRIWVSDLTYIPTDEGWLYLASVLDLASRHLLGWSMDEWHDAGLVVGALEAAVATRGRRRMDGTIFIATAAPRVNSTGRRNISRVRSCDGSQGASTG
jgi:putative transposase